MDYKNGAYRHAQYRRQISKRERFIRYMKRTYKNKLCAIGLFLAGFASIFIDKIDGLYYDATGCVVLWLIAIPLFFMKDDAIC